MKQLRLTLACLVLLAGAAQSQTAPAAGAPDLNAQRASIAAERSSAEARYRQEEEDCYQRFAVNDCLREVRARRRVTFDALRKREIELNDIERQKLAAEQFEKINQQAAERLDSQARRATDAQGRADEPRAGGEGAARKSPLSPALTPAQRAQEKKVYEEKLRQAQERKAQRDKALAEKTGPPARPLPDPP